MRAKKILTVLFILWLGNAFSINYTFYVDRNQLSSIAIDSTLPFNSAFQLFEKLPPDSINETAFYKIFVVGDSLLAVKDGGFDVYVWTANEWKNYYKGQYAGYNFGGYLFIYQGELYSLGGYGFWNYHSNLIRFDFPTGGWEIEQTLNTPSGIMPLLSLLHNDKIYLILGEKRIQSDNIREVSNKVYVLNLSTKKWTSSSYSINFRIPEYNHLLPKFETNGYAYLNAATYTELGLFTWDKENMILRFSPFADANISSTPFIYSNDSLVIYYNKSLKKFIRIDEAVQIKNSKQVADPNFIQNNIITYSIGALVLLLVGFLLIRISGRLKKASVDSANSIQEESEIYYYQQLLPQKGKFLSSDDLDKLLLINQFDYDTRRVRRSNLVKKINAHSKSKTGKEIIHRQRSEKDKRYITYLIKYK